MFVQRSNHYLTRSIALRRSVAAWFAFSFRPRSVERPRGLDAVGASRDRLQQACRRVTENERLVAGWRAWSADEQAAGRDVSVARDLLDRFQVGLEGAMADRDEAEKAQAKMLIDFFEGAKGRLPKTDQELHDWLASPEGKAATAFEPTSLSRWGEAGRS